MGETLFFTKSTFLLRIGNRLKIRKKRKKIALKPMFFLTSIFKGFLSQLGWIWDSKLGFKKGGPLDFFAYFCPRAFQERSRALQERSKSAPRAPKSTQERPKSAPRAFQERPGAFQERPKSRKTCKNNQKRAKTYQNTKNARKRTKTPQND